MLASSVSAFDVSSPPEFSVSAFDVSQRERVLAHLRLASAVLAHLSLGSFSTQVENDCRIMSNMMKRQILFESSA